MAARTSCKHRTNILVSIFCYASILPRNLIIMVLQCQIVCLIHSCVPEDDQSDYEVLLK